MARYGFYPKHYHHIFIGMMLLIVLLMSSVIFVLYEIKNKPLPTFTASQPNGIKMGLTAYQEPNLLPDTILRWSERAATAAYTFDFAHYDTQINAARPYFTDAGWQDYLSSVRNLLDTVVKNALVVNGVVSGPPVISNQGPLPHVSYAWRVQIPFLVTYQSANSTRRQNYYVILTIVKVPTSSNPQGIGIDQFVMV